MEISGVIMTHEQNHFKTRFLKHERELSRLISFMDSAVKLEQIPACDIKILQEKADEINTALVRVYEIFNKYPK